MKGRTKRKRSVDPLSITASPELFAKCFNNDVVLGCLAPFLSQKDLVHLCMCDKRLYAIGPRLWDVLRVCQKQYGGTYDATSKWIKYCLRERELKALHWVFNNLLQTYTHSPKHHIRTSEIGDALASCVRLGLKFSFKLGYLEGIEFVLNWRIKELVPAMNNFISVKELYYYGRNGIEFSLVQAIRTGSKYGHGSVVRAVFETHCKNFIFPCDSSPSFHFPVDVITLSNDDQLKLGFDMLCGCVSNGDETNYPFFYNLYTSLPNAKQNFRLAEDLFVVLLCRGRDPTFLSILLPKLLHDNRRFEEYDAWFRNAFKNKNVSMLRHIIQIVPTNRLIEYRMIILDEYHQIETLLRKAIGQMSWNLTEKKIVKLINALQKRLRFLFDILRRPPLLVDVEDLNPGTTWGRNEWLWKE